jgi:hypothetical protein
MDAVHLEHLPKPKLKGKRNTFLLQHCNNIVLSDLEGIQALTHLEFWDGMYFVPSVSTALEIMYGFELGHSENFRI